VDDGEEEGDWPQEFFNPLAVNTRNLHFLQLNQKVAELRSQERHGHLLFVTFSARGAGTVGHCYFYQPSERRL
jgi:hypothetical protein